MQRVLKQIIWIFGLIIGSQSAFGFALLGPVPAAGNPDDFQVGTIGYNIGDDVGTPKATDDEYRRNTPVLYYSFDASFLNFFGPRGAAEVDKAMAIYNSLTNVSSYSPNLSEFPLDSRRENFRAAAASLLDIKSVTMGLLTEQLGFFQPARWVWGLRARVHVTGTGIPPCPGGMEYTITKRNFDVAPTADPTQYLETSYVNGVLYSYFILEFCTGPNPLADAVEFPVDPLSQPYSAVADFASFWYEGLNPGTFYTSMTRDDVGALRYLIRTNNLNIESAGGRVTEFVTNSQPVAIQTFDLNLFAAQALTNNAAALIALYPGLIINNTSNFFGLAVVTNITGRLTNSPFDPAGFPPTHSSFSTNYTTNFVNFFQHTFGNVVTNTYATRGLVGTVTLSLTNSPFAPAGFPPTVVTNARLSFVPGVFGDFFLLPTNACTGTILSNLLTTVTATTNFPAGTNAPTATNTITFIPGNITFFTNHIIVFLPVSCPVDTVATRQGIERIRFVRRDYDSLINQAWDPVTNDYTLVELTNSTLIPRHMQRRVPRPDFLFTAADLAANNSFTYTGTVDGATETFTVTITGIGTFEYFRTINFNQNNRPPNSAGPGTIEGPAVLPTLIILNKAGPLYFNSNVLLLTNAAPAFLSESTQVPLFPFTWGSFDGTTNAPVVYPNGTTIGELENLLTGPAVTTPYVPSATVGVDYTAQLGAVGGQAPYTWTLAPGSPALPSGLSLSTDGEISGTPDGPPAIYDFTGRVTDSAGASRDLAYTITIF